jgi:hypothetical protein
MEGIMKSRLILSLFLLLTWAASSSGQEVVIGGGMENESDWFVYDMGSGATPSTAEFNYTADKPAAGQGGCLHLYGTGTYTNILVWQAVMLECGKTYELNAAFKELTGDATVGTWVQMRMSTEMPVDGTDYKPPAGTDTDRMLGFNSWADQTWGGLDGTFQVDGLTRDDNPVKTKTYTAPGDPGQTVEAYVSVKAGLWSGTDPLTFDILVDEISLKPAGQAAEDPVFPPTAVTGPFPYGTETKRDDSPVDAVRSSSIVHEYTAYKVTTPPVIDGEVDNDAVWKQIPWTPMTFWENSGYTEEFSVFDGTVSELWTGFEDCTAWWKMLWNDEAVYVAFRVIDDMYNPWSTPTDPGGMHAADCIQFGLHTTPPGADTPADGDYGCELGFGITDAAGPWEEMFANWNYSGHPWANAAMNLAEGDNASGNTSTEGMAIHASVEDKTDYSIYRFEAKLALVSGEYDWSAFVTNGAIGRVTVMAMDHDTPTYEDVNFGSGILTKDFTRLASVLYSPDAPKSTAVESKTRTAPAGFALGQNYPNPFNPVTRIAYSLPRAETVTFSVYSLKGEEVLRLVDGVRQSAGQHELTIDGSRLTSGVYVCKLQTGAVSLSRKIMLVK